MSRKIAREYAYKLIFEFLFSNTVNNRTYELFKCADLDDNDIEYLEKVYSGVTANYTDLLETISHY